MRTAVASIAFFVLAGFAAAEDKTDDKIDAKKLIGKWEPKDAKKGEEFVLEFVDKSKVAVTFTVGDKQMKVEGTYTVTGNKVEVTMMFNGKDIKETHTISKLTDDEMVSKDAKGKEEVMRRVKAK
jgi:uncharacterized protein (TIGR03066 family)